MMKNTCIYAYTHIALSDQIIFIFNENQFIRLKSIDTPYVLHRKLYTLHVYN